MLASIAFIFYVNNFGSYNPTDGRLAGVVVLLLWLYLTSYLVPLGAEIAESERQTARDTTRGEAALWAPATPPPRTRSQRTERVLLPLPRLLRTGATLTAAH